MANAATKIDPFKVKKANSKTGSKSKVQAVKTPANVAKAVDAYREAQDKIKHLEGEASLHKDLIVNFARSEYSNRAMKGETANFKINGNESIATYIMQDASSSLTEEDIELVEAEFGKKAVEELTENDYRSLKFNPEVLEANYDKIVKALQKLPSEILENLFTPMTLKTSKNVVVKATKFAKDEQDLQRLIELLKVKNYIR